MRPAAAAFALICAGGALLAPSPPARAVELTLESRTFVPVHEDGEENFHSGAYEYLDLGIEDLPGTGLYLHVGGWGRVDLAEETYDRTSNGELQYGYLGWLVPGRDAELRLGRLAVTAGAARNETLDGLEVRSGLAAGFEVLAYAGIPLETDAEGRSGDLLYGGRLARGSPGIYEAGVSYLRQDDGDDLSREEAAVDIRVHPLGALTLAGSSFYNLEDDSFARHDYRLTAGPLFSRLTLGATWGLVDYGSYFTAADTTAFTTPQLDPEERLETLGGQASLLLGAGLSLGADYTRYSYELMDRAQAWGGRLDWSRGAFGAGVSWHQTRGEDDRLRYDDYRAHAAVRRGDLSVAAGYQQVRYEIPVNGIDTATAATLAADLDLSPDLTVGADVEYGNNPYYESSWQGMLRLTWRYQASIGKGGGGK